MQGNDLEDLVLLATSRFTVECNLIGSEVYKSFFNWSYGVAECETMFFVIFVTFTSYTSKVTSYSTMLDHHGSAPESNMCFPGLLYIALSSLSVIRCSNSQIS